jgi:TRAP transporter TAXI family solute receptor
MLVLEAFKVNPVAVKYVSSRAEAAAGLKDGTIDAVFFPGYVYPDELTYSAVKAGAYLIPIAGPAVDRLRREHPFVRLVLIPREIYPGQDRILPTVGVDMVVLCRRDLDPAIVYDLTAQLFSAFPHLSGVEATLRFLNPDEAPATPIPLHPGAARYFRERELSR